MPVLVGNRFSKDQFVNDIKIFLRDGAEVNMLLEGVETSPLMIEWAIDQTVEEYNLHPPHIGDVIFATYPSVALLRMGTIINVLMSAGLLQTRNQLTYNDGGISVSIFNKTGLYQSWIRLFRERYDQQLLRIKRAKNAENAYGGVHSEYLTASVHSYFGGELGGGVIESSPGLSLVF